MFINYEPVDSDLNSNNIYDTPAEYIDEDELWSWDDDIYAACGNCSKLSIKGEPAINRIDYVMVGVVNNNSSNTVYGKVLLNEMRMTGVKENPGSAFFIDGTFDLGELLTVGANFSRKQADFHRLEERLGTGANSMQYSVCLLYTSPSPRD